MIPAWAGEYMSLVDFTSGLSATLSEPCDETVFNVDIYDTMAAYAGSIVCYSASTDTLTMDAALLANYTSAYIVVVRADCCSVTSNQVYSGSKMVGVGRSILSGAIYIQ